MTATGQVAAAVVPVVVDASVWVARFVPGDQVHVANLAWLQAQISIRRVLISPTLLPIEVAGSVARVLNDTSRGLQAAQAITALSVVRLVPVDAALTARAYALAATARLCGADGVYAALAQSLGVPLISWDGEQIMRPGAARPWHPGTNVLGFFRRDGDGDDDGRDAGSPKRGHGGHD